MVKPELKTWLKSPIKAVLMDITGVLYESGTKYAIEGSVEALKKLRASKLPFRLVTNETQNTIQNLVIKLNSFGYNFTENEIIAPAVAVRQYLLKHKLRPLLVIHPKIQPEFDGIPTEDPNCVVIGDAASHFTYEAMNGAFQRLMLLKERQREGKLSPIECQSMLISMGKGRFYNEKGSLVLDLGAYTTALEYSCDLKALIIGKPSPDYFSAGLESMDSNFDPSEVVMIGDDIMSDVKGAQNMGMRGVQVKTGKFRPSDENHPLANPDAFVKNLYEAIDSIVAANCQDN